VPKRPVGPALGYIAVSIVSFPVQEFVPSSDASPGRLPGYAVMTVVSRAGSDVSLPESREEL